MHTILLMPQFLRACRRLAVTEEELWEMKLQMSGDPTFGDLIRGTGGARKTRFPREDCGKRSGLRLVSYYAGDDVPLFFLDVYGKGEKISISKAEQNELRGILSQIGDAYRESQKACVAQLAERRMAS